MGVPGVAGGAATGSFPTGVDVVDWIVHPDPGSNGMPPYIWPELFIACDGPQLPDVQPPPIIVLPLSKVVAGTPPAGCP